MDLPETFDLTLQERQIIVGGTKYLLREASEDAATKYRNAAVRGAKMSEGSVTMGDAGNVQAVLVSECLFELGENGNVLRNAPIGIVKAWPSRVVRPLFDWIKEVSMLDETPKGKKTAEDTAKN